MAITPCSPQVRNDGRAYPLNAVQTQFSVNEEHETKRAAQLAMDAYQDAQHGNQSSQQSGRQQSDIVPQPRVWFPDPNESGQNQTTRSLIWKPAEELL